MGYIKFKILVIIFLLFFALAAAIFFYSERENERQFNGTFVNGECVNGNIYQTEKESGFT
ncbi:MAG: hypothetical protein FWB96_08955 [Defluviitaleaceae bacterium]|nr:hypothetical protein [Defluviitaleaceae bacterium]MCL2262949.1 hypothetical protein [Defluviitaleaceae bacterium]